MTLLWPLPQQVRTKYFEVLTLTPETDFSMCAMTDSSVVIWEWNEQDCKYGSCAVIEGHHTGKQSDLCPQTPTPKPLPQLTNAGLTLLLDFRSYFVSCIHPRPEKGHGL